MIAPVPFRSRGLLKSEPPRVLATPFPAWLRKPTGAIRFSSFPKRAAETASPHDSLASGTPRNLPPGYAALSVKSANECRQPVSASAADHAFGPIFAYGPQSSLENPRLPL